MHDDEMSAIDQLYESPYIRAQQQALAQQQAMQVGKMHSKVNTTVSRVSVLPEPPEPPKRIIETTRISKDELAILTPEMRIEMLRNRLLVENIKENDLYPQLDDVCKGLYLVGKGPNPITMMINFETKADLTKFKLAVKI